ncbi:MAG: AraC family transcriptional regulator [Chitinophagaceae bacterium]|nr:MAG: AraC family transcriptional regulator [Chitinophagaceae bacterium]
MIMLCPENGRMNTLCYIEQYSPSMNITYREFSPSFLLQPYVDCYWIQTFSGFAGEVSPNQRCLPLGMMEIIIHLDSNRCEIYENGTWKKLPYVFIAGMYRETVVWRSPSDARKFGIRLKPETFPLLFKSPASLVFSEYTATENLIGNVANPLAEQMSEAQSTASMLAVVETFLLGQLKKGKQENNYIIDAARLIRASKGQCSIDEISRQVHVSIRQLQRSFQEKIGTSPKTYQRIIRFRTACEQLDRVDHLGGWAGLSYELGYSDQSHFLREFREFAGSVPNHLLGQLNQLQGK